MPLEIGRSTRGLYILDDEVARRLVFDSNSSFCNRKTDYNVAPYSLICNEVRKPINL